MCDGAALREQSHRMMVRVSRTRSRQAGWHRRIVFVLSQHLACRDGIFVLEAYLYSSYSPPAERPQAPCKRATMCNMALGESQAGSRTDMLSLDFCFGGESTMFILHRRWRRWQAVDYDRFFSRRAPFPETRVSSH